MSLSYRAEIRKYYKSNWPIRNSGKLRSISYLGGGNHYNYLVKTTRRSFVVRITNPKGLGAGTLFNVEKEFKVLRYVGKYRVGPKALALDTKNFTCPLLIEEYIKGVPYSRLEQLKMAHLRLAVHLMQRISKIPIKGLQPQFSYRSYKTNIETWRSRMSEISKLGRRSQLIADLVASFRDVTRRATPILMRHERALSRSRPVFIYNDIHGNNLFWLPGKRQPIFIDWQKVSTGDPAFMPAVFAVAFEEKSGMKRDVFFNWVMRTYGAPYELFWLRIMEREVSNMIWVVWASLKQGKPLPFRRAENYGRIVRAHEAINVASRLL